MSEIGGIGRGNFNPDRDTRRVPPVEAIVPTGIDRRPPKEDERNGRPKNKEDGKGVFVDFEV